MGRLQCFWALAFSVCCSLSVKAVDQVKINCASFDDNDLKQTDGAVWGKWDDIVLCTTYGVQVFKLFDASWSLMKTIDRLRDEQERCTAVFGGPYNLVQPVSGNPTFFATYDGKKLFGRYANVPKLSNVFNDDRSSVEFAGLFDKARWEAENCARYTAVAGK